MRLPGSSAGRLSGACSPCTGRGLASRSCRHGRWWALTPPFHPYRQRLRRIAAGGLVSVPLSVGFRRLPLGSVLPFGVRTFLEPRRARGHPACVPNSTWEAAESRRPCRIVSHSGQRIEGPSCRTNSPHTGHSSEAPRSSAKSSCSSVRCSGATLIARGTPPRPCPGSARSRRRSARAQRSRAGA